MTPQPTKREIAEVLGVSETDVESWVARGISAGCAGTAADRVAGLATIAHFRAVFADTPAYRAWLRTPHELLSHRAPLDWLAEGRIQYVAEFVSDAASGQPT